MYQKLFFKEQSSLVGKNGKNHSAASNEKKSKGKAGDDNQPYASFDCPECVQMASLMLEEELRYYMQRGSGKRGSKGKSRDLASFMHKRDAALFRSNAPAGTNANANAVKTIGG